MGGPSEVVRLYQSFHHLLDNLRAAQAQLARAERLASLTDQLESEIVNRPGDLRELELVR